MTFSTVLFFATASLVSFTYSQTQYNATANATDYSKLFTFNECSTGVNYTSSNSDGIIFDNRQSSINVRMLISVTGTNIRNSTTVPTTPFLGQVIMTLANHDEQFDGWVDCDGSTVTIQQYPALYNMYMSGFHSRSNYPWGDLSTISSNEFILPDCRDRVVISTTSEDQINLGYGGLDELNLTTPITIKSHKHKVDSYKLSGCSKYNFDALAISFNDICENNTSIDDEDDKVELTNYEKYIALDMYVIAKNGKIINIDEANEMDLYLGEIVFFSGETIQITTNNAAYLPCDGGNLVDNDFNDLFNIYGRRYGGSNKDNIFRLPDCRTRSIKYTNKFKQPYIDNITGLLKEGTLIGGSRIIHYPDVTEHNHVHPISYDIDDSCTITVSMEEKGECNSDIGISNIMRWTGAYFGLYSPKPSTNINNGRPAGSIAMFTSNQLPDNFLQMEGNNYLQNQHAILTSIITSNLLDSTNIITPDFRNTIARQTTESSLLGLKNDRNDYVSCIDLVSQHSHHISISLAKVDNNNNNDRFKFWFILGIILLLLVILAVIIYGSYKYYKNKQDKKIQQGATGEEKEPLSPRVTDEAQQNLDQANNV